MEIDQDLYKDIRFFWNTRAGLGAWAGDGGNDNPLFLLPLESNPDDPKIMGFRA
jgi:hypothetical protein